jgi:hypothetical protein
VVTNDKKGDFVDGLKLIDELISKWSERNQVCAKQKAYNNIDKNLINCILWAIKEVNHANKCYSSVNKHIVVMKYAVMTSSKIFKKNTVLQVK